MKQIFRNSNQNNRNKTATHKIYVETQNGRKPRAVTPTQNPLSYELVQNDLIPNTEINNKRDTDLKHPRKRSITTKISQH